MRMIDRDLLVGAVQPIVLCQQFKPVRLLTASYGADQSLTRSILPDFPLGVSSSLVSTMLVLEQFTVHSHGLNDTLLDGVRLRPHHQCVVKIQVPESRLCCLHNVPLPDA